jgi:hypothetical protein
MTYSYPDAEKLKRSIHGNINHHYCLVVIIAFFRKTKTKKQDLQVAGVCSQYESNAHDLYMYILICYPDNNNTCGG